MSLKEKAKTYMDFTEAYCRLTHKEREKRKHDLVVWYEDAEQQMEKERKFGNAAYATACKYSEKLQELKQKLKSVLNALEHADYGEAREVLKELLKEEKQ
jgi:hypothetical protein